MIHNLLVRLFFLTAVVGVIQIQAATYPLKSRELVGLVRGGDAQSNESHSQQNESKTKNSSSWSSLVSIDPRKLMSILVERAGFLLDEDLKSIAKYIHCGEAKLSVLDRALLIQNFTVSLGDAPEALKISRILITWDSYSIPCLEIEVEDVSILIEFTNIFLTRNNWNELGDHGFPPKVLFYSQGNDESHSPPASTQQKGYDFVRVGKLDLLGQVVLRTRSRPLQKSLCQDIVFSLETIRELNHRIKDVSDQNRRKFKRPGCTSDEIYSLYRSFFTSMAKAAVKSALEEITANQIDPSRETLTVSESKKILASAKQTLLDYAEDVSILSQEQIKRSMKEMLGADKNDADIERIVTNTLGALKQNLEKQSKHSFRRIFKPEQKTSYERNETTEEDPADDVDPIIFPDW